MPAVHVRAPEARLALTSRPSPSAPASARSEILCNGAADTMHGVDEQALELLAGLRVNMVQIGL